MIKRPHLPIPRPSLKQVLLAGIGSGLGVFGLLVTVALYIVAVLTHPNTNHALLPIPDSSFFQFVGQPATGLTITSSVNQLTLRLDAIPARERFSRD